MQSVSPSSWRGRASRSIRRPGVTYTAQSAHPAPTRCPPGIVCNSRGELHRRNPE